MDFIEDFRVSQECAQTGFRAEIDRPATILEARKIGWIRVAELSSTQGDETRIFLLFRRWFRHLKITLSGTARGKIIELLR